MSSLLFAFEGRIRRGEYLKGSLILCGIILGCAIVDIMMGLWSVELSIGLLSGLAMLVSIWPGLALQVKRFHDLDHSGWMCLLTLIPLVNLLVGLYLLFAPGSDRPNRFGLPSGSVISDARRFAGQQPIDRRRDARM
jgi:uncharacterized membrane protein YhaH (DUF805 family)